jgi:hypothetical protein
LVDNVVTKVWQRLGVEYATKAAALILQVFNVFYAVAVGQQYAWRVGTKGVDSGYNRRCDYFV